MLDSCPQEVEDASEDGLRSYASSLEYLGDQFATLTLQIQVRLGSTFLFAPYPSHQVLSCFHFLSFTDVQLSREQLKREMREHISDEPTAYSWENERHAKRTNLHEFEAKLRLIRGRMQRRLEIGAKEKYSVHI
jgi:hypothetical protein